jgi:hypothetical protein
VKNWCDFGPPHPTLFPRRGDDKSEGSAVRILRLISGTLR